MRVEVVRTVLLASVLVCVPRAHGATGDAPECDHGSRLWMAAPPETGSGEANGTNKDVTKEENKDDPQAGEAAPGTGKNEPGKKEEPKEEEPKEAKPPQPEEIRKAVARLSLELDA